MRINCWTLTIKSTLIAGTTARKLCHCASIYTWFDRPWHIFIVSALVLAEIVESRWRCRDWLTAKLQSVTSSRAKNKKASFFNFSLTWEEHCTSIYRAFQHTLTSIWTSTLTVNILIKILIDISIAYNYEGIKMKDHAH